MKMIKCKTCHDKPGLSVVYNQPKEPDAYTVDSIKFEKDPRVRVCIDDGGDAFRSAYERLITASQVLVFPSIRSVPDPRHLESHCICP